MNVLLETAFHRLLSRYERTFGDVPPFTATSAEEAVDYMRRRLRETAAGADFRARRAAAAQPSASAGVA